MALTLVLVALAAMLLGLAGSVLVTRHFASRPESPGGAVPGRAHPSPGVEVNV